MKAPNLLTQGRVAAYVFALQLTQSTPGGGDHFLRVPVLGWVQRETERQTTFSGGPLFYDTPRSVFMLYTRLFSGLMSTPDENRLPWKARLLNIYPKSSWCLEWLLNRTLFICRNLSKCDSCQTSTVGCRSQWTTQNSRITRKTTQCPIVETSDLQVKCRITAPLHAWLVAITHSPLQLRGYKLEKRRSEQR